MGLLCLHLCRQSLRAVVSISGPLAGPSGPSEQPAHVQFTPGLYVSAASDPIPHRLVQRVWNGEFVEMRELLADHISLYNQLEDSRGYTSCLCPAYERFPCSCPRFTGVLAYCQLIIREALQYRGLEYN